MLLNSGKFELILSITNGTAATTANLDFLYACFFHHDITQNVNSSTPKNKWNKIPTTTSLLPTNVNKPRRFTWEKQHKTSQFVKIIFFHRCSWICPDRKQTPTKRLVDRYHKHKTLTNIKQKPRKQWFQNAEHYTVHGTLSVRKAMGCYIGHEIQN